jgi:hypothetical protein
VRSVPNETLPLFHDYFEERGQLDTKKNEYHRTDRYQKRMRKRGVWVELLFREAKDFHRLRRFRLPGLLKVSIEGVIISAGQNL